MIKQLTLIILLAPLLGSLIAGIAGKQIGRRGAHWVTILGVGIAFILSCYVFKLSVIDHQKFNGMLYAWVISGNIKLHVGLLVDRLAVVMMVTVTFVSLLVHIYSIGYMAEDTGYQRFFCYMSAFTFAMLSLVLANNFVLLFFGWEGVGLVSYLLIGFWFKKDSAAAGGLKAFIVNRVGDFGFLLGLAVIVDNFGSLDYKTVFAKAPLLADTTMSVFPGSHWLVITVICLLLFIGAMGKSAQMPLHIWLPESMEGPTPISALIHAATMVTAGVYLLARMSPLFELSHVALTVVLVIGATGALLMGLVGVVQTDIKRVIAYSTMSQLGYMVAACGASAFSLGIYHLVTHACFKALLFLAAGSVIIALHHEQDLRKMGGLKRELPVTYFSFLIGALALSAIPPFAGFYSKDAIITAVRYAPIAGSHYAYICLLLGTFVTALYIFRAFFLAFHGKEHLDDKLESVIQEPSQVILWPIALLAVPSILLGLVMTWPVISGRLFGNSIVIAEQYNVIPIVTSEFHNVAVVVVDAFTTLPFWLSIAGIFTAWLCYVKFVHLPVLFRNRINWLYQILWNKYGFDALNQLVFVKGTRFLSDFFYYFADMKVLDGWFVNGTGRGIDRVAKVMRRLQTGYLYHYAFAMIVGLVILLFVVSY